MRAPNFSVSLSPAWPTLIEKVAQGLVVRVHSGKVRPGEVFVALPGTKVSGEDFIPMALENGAAYVVAASGRNWPENAKAELVIHPHPALALGELARAHFKTDENSLKLVGVTGTNGKTTVSYLVEFLLAANGMRAGVIGTVSYRWPSVVIEATMTTPDCWKLHELLANMARADVDVAVMEVSSHALDQDRVAGLSFDVGVMTNLSQDHLDYHPDMESYFAAKAKLFTSYAADSMTAVLNYEDPFCARLLALAPRPVGYGLTDPPEGAYTPMRGTLTSSDASGLAMDVAYNGSARWSFSSPLVGRYNAMNLLAAQAVGLSMGLSPKELKRLSKFTGVPGRMQRIENDKGMNVFVDFAHTPDALENALSELRRLDIGKLIVVFGCGGDRDRAKRPLMGRAVARHADVAVLTSDNPRSEDPLQIMADARPGLAFCDKVIEEPDRRAAIGLALDEAGPDDVVIVAGKGHETYQQIGDKKYPFSDAKVVREYLS